MLTARLHGPMAAAMLAVLLLAGCDDPEERAESHFQRGIALEEADEPEKAFIEFRNAVRLKGDHVGARLAIAQQVESRGNLESALRNYEIVATADPSNVEARIALARIYLVAGALEEAQDAAAEAIALAPDDPEALATQANVLYRLGDVDAAMVAADAALALAPDMVMAHSVGIANALEKDGPEAALRMTEELLERMPDEPSLNVMRLRFAAQAGDDARVRSQLERMVALDPENEELRQALAQIYLQAGELDAAETELRTLADMSDNGTMNLVRLIYSRRGPDGAREELEARIASADMPEARLSLTVMLSELYLSEGDVAAARAVLEREIENGATDVETDGARLRLAELSLQDGDRAAAELLVDTVLERDEANVAALGLRARMKIMDDRLEDAILILREALNLEPQNVTLLLLEAEAQQRMGNLSLVQDRLGAATRFSDFRPDVALRNAAFLQSRGQNTAMVTVLQESARRNPLNRQVLTALAEAQLRTGDLVGADQTAQQLRTLEGGGEVADQVVAAGLAREGRLDESISILESIVDNGEDGQRALASLIAGYIQTDQRDRAVALLDRLVAENPKNVRALVLRAELHLLQGETDAAEARLRDVIAAQPDDALGYLLMARFLDSQGRGDESAAVTREGYEKVPDDSALALVYANKREQSGDFDAAIAAYERLYRSNPQSVIVANNLASLLAEHHADDPGRLSKATTLGRRLRNNELPHIQDTYGWIAFLNGDIAEALRALTIAADGLPDNPLVRYHLGRAYAEAGEAEKARAELEAALSLDSEFPKAASAREALAGLPEG
jgi:tetratricopeptide (TPR) repeat protein